MKLDYLDGTPYKIHQEKDMYHFNSDTEILGKYLRINERDTVLDVGTNNGALLFYASLFNPKLLVGIDIFEEVINIARDNLKMNNVEASLYTSKFQDFKHDKFSIIISNPPYFNSLNETNNKYLLAARHENHLTLDELFSNTDRLLETEGKLYLVYPYTKRFDVIKNADKYKFYLEETRIAYDHKGGNKKSMLFTFCRNNYGYTIINRVIYLDDRKTFTL